MHHVMRVNIHAVETINLTHVVIIKSQISRKVFNNFLKSAKCN